MALLLCGALGTRAAAQAPPTSPLQADVGIFVIDITNFNQQENTFDVELDVVTRWQDPQRAFEPTAIEPPFRVYKADAALEELANGWTPELYILNTVGTPSLGVVRRPCRFTSKV